ncbi:16S rRNA (uracil(1498)-N(3))-methyltransferase [Cyanobium sp. NIES-981]|uniref:RsmE family RNA methyltransferase n=1 Tax=Cyanobium sp. NIES-981 TaxID=1851505 RepID=UPI0007DD2C9A|nr:RsmE family RNA methyltransferase [Cyanobium sp. NIES-981]SBO41912.1 Ribosomal RNA small subunit methyltransferase E [Cyanobium sp. NIES-981]
MSRELRRLLVDPPRLQAPGGLLPLEREELHYLRRVLRLRQGERFAVVDGCGRLWSATMPQDPPQQTQGAQLEQPLDQPLVRSSRPTPALRLAIAPPRRDPEVLLRMACELGIDQFQWLQAERSVAAAPPRDGRQRSVLREAIEQCERLWLPRCSGPEPASGWFARQPEGELLLLATTRCPAAVPLLELLFSAAPQRLASVSLAVGPEGGWSPQEEALALETGWRAVSLGDGILRSSTAVVAAASLLSAWRQSRQLRLSSGTSDPPSP